MSDVRVILDHNAIQGVEKKAYQALGMTAKVLQDEIRDEEVIPMDTGHLSGEAFFVDTTTEMKGYVRMIFQTPYARRLYFHPEFHFRKGYHANAQGLWIKPWQNGGKYEKRPQEIFAKILKRYF